MSINELYIGNINPDVKLQEIKQIFEQYGTVTRCELKYGGSAYSAAYGFVGFEYCAEAERAQLLEHGRNHSGRRMIVEFTKTIPGQSGRLGRTKICDERMEYRNSNRRDRPRSPNRYRSRGDQRGGGPRGRYQRRPSPFYGRISSEDRTNNGDRRRKRDRSRSPRDRNSSSKRHRLSSNDARHRTSSSHKDGNSKKR